MLVDDRDNLKHFFSCAARFVVLTKTACFAVCFSGGAPPIPLASSAQRLPTASTMVPDVGQYSPSRLFKISDYWMFRPGHENMHATYRDRDTARYVHVHTRTRIRIYIHTYT